MRVCGGEAFEDRISFFTSKNQGTAIRNEDGTITIDDYVKKEEDISLNRFYVFMVAILVIKNLLIIFFISKGMLSKEWYLLPTVILSILFIYSLKPFIEQEQLRKNHGAEHMVFSAYKKLKKIPTIEESMRFSRINAKCGTTLVGSLITAQLIGYFVYKFIGYEIPDIVLFIAPFIVGGVVPLSFIGVLGQLIVTNKPDNKNIELAIAAISALEKEEMKEEIVWMQLNR
jgi:uncharacterized protein YqhQ